MAGPIESQVAVRVPWPGIRDEWPLNGLDLDDLRVRGWRPTPIHQFIIKIHGRCDLACDYCYVFQMQDTTWRSRPAAMARETLVAAAERIAQHVRRHDLDTVTIVFHGGEPLLAGPGFISDAARALRACLPSSNVELAVQTNGTHLTDEVVRTLFEHRISVGVSVDGGAAAHDRYRRSANGRGSFGAVVAGLRRLREPPYGDLFTGLLCTIDLQNDPVETYESLLTFDPPRVDFLLPHGNWTNPPSGREPTSRSAPYGDWLIAVFDRWYDVPRRETGVRLFEEIASLCLGGPSRIESVGLAPVSLLVIDTDGSFEQVDALRSAYDGAAATGLNVFDHPVDATLTHPAVAVRQSGVEGLCGTCRGCVVRDVCGGGFYPHRYRSGSGYLNPSVYCPDLLRLIQHIRGRVLRDARALLND